MTEFTDPAEKAVHRFLQSVMVIDDRAQYGPETSVTTLAKPTKGHTGEEDEDEDPTQAPGSLLDAKALVDAFAEEGLVCGVMRPDPPTEPRTEIVLPAASKADIVVLDWHLYDNGEHALAILRGLAGEPGLRLAAVYTYDEKLDEIASSICEEIHGTVSGKFRVTVGAFVVEVYAKEGTGLSGEAAGRVHTPVELAARLIRDFARMTKGIVPTAAVAAIGALRRETPRVLALLSPELDPGYLGHRILLTDPEEAARQLLDLIGAELRTAIEDDEIVQTAISQPTIEHYVRGLDSYEGALPLEIINRALEIGTSRVEAKQEILSNTAVQAEPNEERLGSRKRSQTHRFTQGDHDVAGRADVLFGQRMSLRTETNTAPYLQLGTIIRADGEWLVCVQPDCDAVRVDDEREFPFLRATAVGLDKRVDAVVSLDGADQTLRIDHHLYSLRQMRFTPDAATRTVTAERHDGKWTFSSVDGNECRFVAQFKRDHARRLVQVFANTGSRVGLDESELFRRWGERS